MRIIILMLGLSALSHALFGQQTITGKVVDTETKLALQDAQVHVKGTTTATKTNFGGYFQLTLDSVRELIISAPGYDTGYVTIAPELKRIQASLSKLRPNVEVDSNAIYTVVEEMPEFVGGQKVRQLYIAKNLTYPTDARRMGIEGKVFVQFVVNRDGSIPPDLIEVIKSVSPSCDAEVVRLVKGFPRWKPGYQNHKPVRARFVLPITFKLDVSNGTFPNRR